MTTENCVADCLSSSVYVAQIHTSAFTHHDLKEIKPVAWLTRSLSSHCMCVCHFRWKFHTKCAFTDISDVACSNPTTKCFHKRFISTTKQVQIRRIVFCLQSTSIGRQFMPTYALCALTFVWCVSYHSFHLWGCTIVFFIIVSLHLCEAYDDVSGNGTNDVGFMCGTAHTRDSIQFQNTVCAEHQTIDSINYKEWFCFE